jgi:hypothetical protein
VTNKPKKEPCPRCGRTERIEETGYDLIYVYCVCGFLLAKKEKG